jgi:exopolyphosphatase/guanosine-5'-triphosphate,3'-diphosphate pyrophosphatase
MRSEKLAAVDIGTNSTRLLIAERSEDAVRSLVTALRTTRIGEGISSEQRLQPEPVQRTIAALAEYRRLLRQHGVQRWRLVATSAVRDAVNRASFVGRVRDELGLEVEVISGEEEARLGYLGACSALPQAAAAVIDIGGGSTEFSWPEPQAPRIAGRGSGRQQAVSVNNGSGEGDRGRGARPAINGCSVPMGAVRLTEKPLLLSELLAVYRQPCDRIKGAGLTLVGVGGTITTLAAIDQALDPYDSSRIQGYALQRSRVERILFDLAAKDKQQRLTVPGLQPGRADIIVAGTTILWAVLGYLELEQITVSDADLLQGVILEL